MTLHIFPDVEQGTEEWMDQRRGMVTASAVDKLVTGKTLAVANNEVSRGLTRLLTAERITGWTDPTYVSDDMLRGTMEEPLAREAYAKSREVEVAEMGFMVRDDWGFDIGLSPDGLVGEEGLIEIKSRRAKKHLETILADEVPAENMAQVQCALLVSGREWVDYVSFCSGMPLWTKRVTPDERWQKAIVEAVAAFEKASAEMASTYLARVEGLPMTERYIEMEMVI